VTRVCAEKEERDHKTQATASPPPPTTTTTTTTVAPPPPQSVSGQSVF